MRAFNIGQRVWIHKDDLVFRYLGTSFFAVEIKEITTSETKEGILTRYVLSNGDSKPEGAMFASKEDVIDYVISMLEEEKGRE